MGGASAAHGGTDTRHASGAAEGGTSDALVFHSGLNCSVSVGCPWYGHSECNNKVTSVFLNNHHSPEVELAGFVGNGAGDDDSGDGDSEAWWNDGGKDADIVGLTGRRYPAAGGGFALGFGRR